MPVITTRFLGSVSRAMAVTTMAVSERGTMERNVSLWARAENERVVLRRGAHHGVTWLRPEGGIAREARWKSAGRSAV